MPDPKEICVIVPLGQDGFQPLVYGMGFLAGDCDILTCAHVIEATLGTEWQKGPGTVQVCFPFSETEGRFLTLTGQVDRKRWFPPGDPTPGKPTDIAVITLQAPAPNSVKRATLLNASVESDVLLKVYGFPGAQTPQGYISHPTGLYVEGKVVGDLPGGRAQFQGTWVTGIAVQRGYSGASVYDPKRDSIVGMVVRADRNEVTKIAEFIDAPSLRLALGTIGSAAGALNIQRTRTIPQALYNQTVRKKQEIEAYLKEIGEILPQPDPDGDLAGLLETILFRSPEPLRVAFGFVGETEELRPLFQLMRVGNPLVQALWGKWAQRVDQALWRYRYTLDYVDGEWVDGVRQRVRELRTICEPHRPAKQPTLKDISAILSHGSHNMTPFIEYTPDGELYAVMRSFRSPIPLTGPRTSDLVGDAEPDSGPALAFILEYLDSLKEGTRQIDDSSNAWWAVRIGICRRDERFRERLAFIAEKFAEPRVPQEQAANNPMPEIYKPVSTVSYTMSNAQAILECEPAIGEDLKNRLHEVIENMRERLLATPVSRNLYLASVHQEGLRNYLDYLKDQGITTESARTESQPEKK